MAQWSDAVITLGGVELLNKVVEGKRLLLDQAAGGSGVVDVAALMVQSGLKNQKQQFAIAVISQAELGKKIHVVITNSGLVQGYTLNQLGIWAHIEGEPSRLLCILQDSEGVNIPSESELLDFALDFYAAIAVSNESQIELSVDPSALVSMGTLQAALALLPQLDASGKIPDDLLPDMDYIPTEDKGKAGGVASLDTSGKVPNGQLNLDEEMSATSEKPVKNKVIQAALTTLSNALTNAVTSINNALNGKAASNHSHSYAGSSSAGGAANSAVKLQTARSIHVNLGSSGAVNFDGSGNANPGVYGILGVGGGGTGANNASTARANLGINLANLGGCRVVTGIYTGNGSSRQCATQYNFATLTGGQFINLGAKPKFVKVAMISNQSGYANTFGWAYQIMATDNMRQFIVSNNWEISIGGIPSNQREGVYIDIVDGGFYVGNSLQVNSTYGTTNREGYIYAYVAII